VKAPAGLAVLAIAWCCWKGARHRRATSMAVGLALIIGALATTGLGSGGGFNWLRPASFGTVASSFSVLRLAGFTSSTSVNAAQLAGMLAAAVLLVSLSRGGNWVGPLALGFAVMALFAANPQPWYLLWALPILACTLGDGGVQRAGILVLCAMTAWSEMPFGVLVWFAGIIALAVIWISRRRSWQDIGLFPHRLPTGPSESLSSPLS
jgi:hypothetical protein